MSSIRSKAECENDNLCITLPKNEKACECKWINHENIGKTSEELVGMWHEANPNDPATFSAN